MKLVETILGDDRMRRASQHVLPRLLLVKDALLWRGIPHSCLNILEALLRVHERGLVKFVIFV